jgi:hypothetical protein
MMMSVEQSVEWLVTEIELRGGNLPQCRFIHHKSRQSYGAAVEGSYHLQCFPDIHFIIPWQKIV